MKLDRQIFIDTGILSVLFLLALPAFAHSAKRQTAKETQWVLEKSTLTYHVTHPLHHVEGVSHAARGKGLCEKGECSFLVAAPVKSFASGDTNRDLHMLQITRGGKYPMVIVRAQLSASALQAKTLHANLVIQFAGKTTHFQQVLFHLVHHGNEFRLTGTIPTTLTDFKIPAPELLFVPIRNQISVSVNMLWQKAE